MKKHLQEIIDIFARDNTKTRILQPDGTYLPAPAGGEPRDAQEEFLDEATRRRKRHAAEQG